MRRGLKRRLRKRMGRLFGRTLRSRRITRSRRGGIRL